MQKPAEWKELTRAQQVAWYKQKKRREEQAFRPRCKVCGKPFAGRAWDEKTGDIRNPVTREIMAHQKCAQAEWTRVHRALSQLEKSE